MPYKNPDNATDLRPDRYSLLSLSQPLMTAEPAQRTLDKPKQANAMLVGRGRCWALFAIPSLALAASRIRICLLFVKGGGAVLKNSSYTSLWA